MVRSSLTPDSDVKLAFSMAPEVHSMTYKVFVCFFISINLHHYSFRLSTKKWHRLCFSNFLCSLFDIGLRKINSRTQRNNSRNSKVTLKCVPLLVLIIKSKKIIIKENTCIKGKTNFKLAKFI